MIPLRKSKSMGPLPGHLGTDEHADHASGVSGSGCSPPEGCSKFVYSLPQDSPRANFFQRQHEVCSSHIMQLKSAGLLA